MRKISKSRSTVLFIILFLFSFSITTLALPEERLPLEQGLELLDKGLYEEAIEEFQKAIAEDPFSSQAYVGLGKAYYQQVMFDEAIASFEKSLALKPLDREEKMEINRYLASLYLANGWKDKARRQLEINLEIEPNYTLNPDETSQEMISLFKELIEGKAVGEERGKGLLSISSDPPGAKIYIDGYYIGRTPLKEASLYAGRRLITLEKPNYARWEEVRDIKSDILSEVQAILSKTAQGILSISTTPSYAKVYVDGYFVGGTPLKGYRVQTGLREIKVAKAGYRTWSTRRLIEPNKALSLDLKLELSPDVKFGCLDIDSIPQGAEIYINGEYIGKTKLNIACVVPGRHFIKLSKNGYHDWRATIKIEAEERRKITAQLTREYGYLTIRDLPLGTPVFIDGEELDLSDEDIMRNYLVEDEVKDTFSLIQFPLLAGKHLLRLDKENYGTRIEEIDIEVYGTLELKGGLPPLQGFISLGSDPPAEVYIKTMKKVIGEEVVKGDKTYDYLGSTPLNRYKLPVGIYRIRITKTGYKDWEETILILRGEHFRKFISLEPDFDR